MKLSLSFPLLASLFLTVLTSPAFAGQGDYTLSKRRGDAIVYWDVIDPDPAGLNCRMPRDLHGADLEAVMGPIMSGGEYDGGYIRVSEWWPPVTQIKPGTRVRAAVGNLQIQEVVKDYRYKPWLGIKTDRGDCFVRAHNTLIRPSANQPPKY